MISKEGDECQNILNEGKLDIIPKMGKFILSWINGSKQRSLCIIQSALTLTQLYTNIPTLFLFYSTFYFIFCYSVELAEFLRVSTYEYLRVNTYEYLRVSTYEYFPHDRLGHQSVATAVSPRRHRHRGEYN